jgi:hypothetical protein
MLVRHKSTSCRGHYYYREEPWPDTWYYDKFGRKPELGDYFVYTTTDPDGIHHLHFGVIYLQSHIIKARDPLTGKPSWVLTIFHYAKVRSSPVPHKGEKLVKTLKNGLSLFSPFYELSQVRSENGIILLKSGIETGAFPHLS